MRSSESRLHDARSSVWQVQIARVGGWRDDAKGPQMVMVQQLGRQWAAHVKLGLQCLWAKQMKAKDLKSCLPSPCTYSTLVGLLGFSHMRETCTYLVSAWMVQVCSQGSVLACGTYSTHDHVRTSLVELAPCSPSRLHRHGEGSGRAGGGPTAPAQLAPQALSGDSAVSAMR